ncbi:Factor of DNA methylation 1 [Dichanthelium oligosanthes]|uniref:Factor of DNA methylation 1 n=1 Tax=Dichanthelium oligosanthes TaxID=888268 RepID=A0A1E5VTW3_9POAL|nr:Factor of DNA methylation 1 [Dichanthelium oligosanthes]
MKEDLLLSKDTLVEARDKLVALTDEIARKNCYVEFLTKKLQESEAKNNETAQQCGSVMGLIQPRGVQTGSVEKQKRLSERPHGNDAVNLEGFLEIDFGGRKIGIKEMGQLNEKAFKAACLAKVPPEEVGAASYELYTSWQQQIGDLSWYPFKTVTVDGNNQEIVNVDDDKLQELKRAWGSGAHNAVVNALAEMKEYGCLSDRSIANELWNYKEGRRATTRECINYMSNQVKLLSATKRRKMRRSSGKA